MNAHTIVWSSLAMQPAPVPVPVPAPKSFLMWMLETGSWSDLFTPIFGLAIFIGACLVVAKSRRTSTIAACLVLLPLPTYIGILSQLKGIYASLSVIAVSGVQPSGQEWIGGFANTALTMFVCLLVTLPSYLVLAYGLLASTRNSSASPAL
ncbi:MAG: hypothetical protein AABP62_00085 [Planctomycetota bacterium]